MAPRLLYQIGKIMSRIHYENGFQSDISTIPNHTPWPCKMRPFRVRGIPTRLNLESTDQISKTWVTLVEIVVWDGFRVAQSESSTFTLHRYMYMTLLLDVTGNAGAGVEAEVGSDVLSVGITTSSSGNKTAWTH